MASLGGKIYEEEVKRDLEKEPFIICECEKRKKCDSFYLKLYNDLMKKYTKLQSELEDYKSLLRIYQGIVRDSIDKLEGGENNERKRYSTIK